MGSIPIGTNLCNNLGQVVHTYVPLSPSSITSYWSKDDDVLWRRRWPQAWRKVMAADGRDDFKKSPAGWLPVHRDQLRAQRSVTSMGELFLFYICGHNFGLTPFIFTARSSYASAVFGIVILSVCLPVRPSSVCFATKWKNILPIFWYHMKGQSLWFSDTNRGWWVMSPSTWYLRLKWPTSFEKRRLRPISAYTVSTVRASEKCSIIVNRKSITRFLTSYT